jgi:hypothetical protein
MKLTYKPYPSEYELKYIIWNGLDYDRDKLIRFADYYNSVSIESETNPTKKEELSILHKILSQYDMGTLEKLLQNDETVCRMALIEKWARTAALEKLLNKSYSKDTYEVISNLPLSDYQLTVKRINELMSIVNSTTYQTEEYPKHLPST